MKLKFNTRQFSYHKDLNTFTADASDLNLQPGDFPTSFSLTSAQTGQTVTLMSESEIYSDGGEWYGRKYQVEIAGDTAKAFTVEIFND